MLELFEKHPNEIFIESPEVTFTYTEFKDAFIKLASQLSVKKNELVPVTTKLDYKYLLMVFALWHKKAIPCFINQFSRTEQIKKLTLDVPFGKILEGDHLRSIFWTSGSSSQPKAVQLSFDNHFYNALGANENIPLVPGNKWHAHLPFFHVGGFAPFIRCLIAGASVVISKDFSKSTHVSMVSTQLKRFADKPFKNNFKCVLLGGGPMSDSLLDKALQQNLPMYKTYGLTEMASQVTTTKLNQLGSSGLLLKYRKLKIIDNEVCLAGKTLFEGYIKKGQLVPKTGWHHTGDLGYYSNGMLNITGRKDRLFQSAGENIQPEAIEMALMTIEGVSQAHVAPQKHDEYGYRPIAYVDSSIPYNNIIEQLKDKVSGIELPVEIKNWNQMNESTKDNVNSLKSRLK